MTTAPKPARCRGLLIRRTAASCRGEHFRVRVRRAVSHDLRRYVVGCRAHNTDGEGQVSYYSVSSVTQNGCSVSRIADASGAALTGLLTESVDERELVSLRSSERAAVVVATVAGTIARFATTSHLWLDEALTVNIARLPLSQIPTALRQDGHPPLFYFLLHGWMAVAGQSDVAVRACPACCPWSLYRWPGESGSGSGAGWRRGRFSVFSHCRPSPSAMEPRPACMRW